LIESRVVPQPLAELLSAKLSHILDAHFVQLAAHLYHQLLFRLLPQRLLISFLLER
jgi:hypothetical protein